MAPPIFHRPCILALLFFLRFSSQEVEALPVINVYATTASVNEPFGVGEFLITREGEGEVVVQFNIAGTATAGTDYTLIPGNRTVTIPATTNVAVVQLRVLEDSIVEGDENVVLKIAPSATYSIGAASQAAMLIHDNDPDGLPTVTLIVPLLVARSIPITVRGEAHGSVSQAWIYDNGALVATPIVRHFETVSLFERNWTPESEGLHQLMAVVKDDRGLTATSTVPVLVAEAIRTPTVTGSSADGVTVTQGDLITTIVPNDRGYGFVEFPIPALKDANAILEFSGRGSFVHELYVYSADGFIKEDDLTAAAEFVTRFNEEPRASETFHIDVTAWAKRYAGKAMGFRFKALRPETWSGLAQTVAQTFTAFQLIDIARTNDVPPSAQWLNPPANMIAFAEEPLVLNFRVLDPDSRITRLSLIGEAPVATIATDLPSGTNVVALTWPNPAPQTVELQLRIETDTGAVSVEKFLPLLVTEARRGDPLHKWTARANWGDAFFIVDADGRAWAWGANDWGQLGLGVEDTVVFPPRLLEPPAGRKWRQFASGQLISGALTDNGELYVMKRGANPRSQEPFPEGVYFWREVASAGGILWLLDQSGYVWLRWSGSQYDRKDTSFRVRKIASHYEGVSVLAEREDGMLVTVPGDQDPVLMPLGVDSWLEFSALIHTVGIGSDRQLYAWGNSSFPGWELPVFPIYPQPTRVPTPGIAGWKRVAVNRASTVAIDQQGRIFEWGTSGSLDPKLYEPHLIDIPNETGWLDIGVGEYFTVAVSTKGNVYMWGEVPTQPGVWTRIISPQQVNIPAIWKNQLQVTTVTNGMLMAEAVGVPGTVVTIESSPDLVNWTAITNLANPNGKTEFAQPISTSGSLFIRAR